MLDGMHSAGDLVANYELDDDFDPYRFVPPGPVSQAFLQDNVLASFIMGPVGGGKTVACAFKRVRAALMMPPCADGVIRDRWVVLRPSFRDAEKTVLASWKQWFPKGYPGSSWQGGNDRPVTHVLRFHLVDGTRVEAVTEFIGLNGERVEAKLRGWEISGAWMNEADTFDEQALRFLEQRTGRYPAMRDMPPGTKRFRQVIGDFNAPDMDNWTYATFIENASPNRRLYVQPSGLSRDAENVKNLEPDYYQKIVENEEEWYVRRFVHNEFGYSREGRPVYEAFNDRLHVGDVRPDGNLPLLIGMDAGLTPAAVFCQPAPDGQLRVTDELVPGHGYGAQRFSELVQEIIARRYPTVRDVRAWCDPAAQYGADREGGEMAWIETVSMALGIPVLIPANGSNEIGLRLDAVKRELLSTIDGRKPRLLLGAHCTTLRRGFASKYRYARRKASTGAEYEPLPEKNAFSHPHDALQYVVLGYRGRQSVTRGDGWSGRAHAHGGQSTTRVSSGRRDFDVHKL